MNQELVTIGIPLYNMADSISAAIDSCLSQTYQDFEIIIVDDGSTDNSVQIVESFNDKRIVLHKKTHNSGVCETMNAIVNLAQGKYIAFLDADDLMMSERIEKQYNAIKKAEKDYPNKMVASFCGSKVVNQKNKKVSFIDPNNLFIKDFGGGTGHSMYKVDDIKSLGYFDTNFPRSADSALCLDFLINNGHYAMIKEPMIVYNFVWNKEKENCSKKEQVKFMEVLNDKLKDVNIDNKLLMRLNGPLIAKNERNLMKANARAGKSVYLKHYKKRRKITGKIDLYLLLCCTFKCLFAKAKKKFETKLGKNLEPHTYFISRLFDSCNYLNYLELGTFDGNGFKYFLEQNKPQIARCVDMIRRHDISEKYFYEMTTDEFFIQNKNKFDLIFIDASHEYNQVVKDFENSLNVLNIGGTIILHDTDPMESQLLAPEYCDDSYKMHDYLDHHPELMYMTVPISNCGLTIVRKKDDLRYKKVIKIAEIKANV